MPERSTLRFAPPSVDALRSEIADNLSRGRIFVPGAKAVAEREICDLVVVHPTTGAELTLEAEAVWVKTDDPGAGVGLQVRIGPETTEQLTAFADATDATAERDDSRVPRNIYERVRSLSNRERETMARQGTLAERVALERTYGSAVWEGLLSNPMLTPPEVTRIARNGTLPQPFAGLIVANAGWIAQPEVQRALLSNPRITGSLLDRVLSAMPRNELSRLVQQGGYRTVVRSTAKRILGL